MAGGEYEKNVFINCPFDKAYTPLLRPLLFTVVQLGFHPRIASERSDSGENRLSKICSLIDESKNSIHDLSRLKASAEGEFYRLNMPFEFGIDYGCRVLGEKQHAEKRFLVLAGDPFEYHRALSDASGIDIKYHNEEPAKIVRRVRDWFLETVGLLGIPSPTRMWQDFNEFMADFYERRKSEGFSGEDLTMMPVPELLDFMIQWRDRSP